MDIPASPWTDDALLSPDEVARRLDVSVETLSAWRTRARRKPLPFVKLGGKLARYRAADVERFITECVHA
jgi:excisionase family DNA binding protein